MRGGKLKKKCLFKPKIKKDDIIIILSGKDKGKQGIVLKVIKKIYNYKLLVEGINIKKNMLKEIHKNKKQEV